MIDVISDASVVLKWFHSDGEEQVAEARALIGGHAHRTISVSVLNLTPYEVGNALLRGRAHADANEVATVLRSLGDICPQATPTRLDFHLAARLAQRHGLTFYDAVYAAVAQQRGAMLATVDAALLRSGLGRSPADLVAELGLGAA